MRLYLDEMISPVVARALREQGYDVVSTAERDALGASDAGQLARAISEERALVTYNVSDFAPLAKAAASSGRDLFGMIFIASQKLPSSRLGDLIRVLAGLLAERSEDDALRTRPCSWRLRAEPPCHRQVPPVHDRPCGSLRSCAQARPSADGISP